MHKIPYGLQGIIHELINNLWINYPVCLRYNKKPPAIQWTTGGFLFM